MDSPRSASPQGGNSSQPPEYNGNNEPVHGAPSRSEIHPPRTRAGDLYAQLFDNWPEADPVAERNKPPEVAADDRLTESSSTAARRATDQPSAHPVSEIAAPVDIPETPVRPTDSLRAALDREAFKVPVVDDDVWTKPPHAASATPFEVAPPACPMTVADTGLPMQQIAELIVKHLHLQRNLLGVEIARQVRLPFQLIEEALRFLKEQQCIEVVSGDMIGPASFRFSLTERGQNRATAAFQHCRYVGPAPVPLEDYVKQCARQSVSHVHCSPAALQEAFGDIFLRPNLLEELGPAVCSGQSIFVYGPSGNGKTLISKALGRFLNRSGGDIYVPYAIATEGSIVTVFDPTIHQVTDDAHNINSGEAGEANARSAGASELLPDSRWRRIRRPVVVTGGELTLEMLDLRFNADSNFYTAPLHIKANGGVFLIDDFGRQIVSPRDLLNRWILPLEDRVDFLTMATGKKIAVPFEQLTIFSTNLDPRELVDEAFLRRIRHKIRVGPPTRDNFSSIFEIYCRKKKIPFETTAVDYLYANFYDRGKPPRASDPQDLLEIVGSICRFRGEEVVLSHSLLAEATDRFFCQL